MKDCDDTFGDLCILFLSNEMQTTPPWIGNLAAQVFVADRLILKILKKCEGRCFIEITTFQKYF